MDTSRELSNAAREQNTAPEPTPCDQAPALLPPSQHPVPQSALAPISISTLLERRARPTDRRTAPLALRLRKGLWLDFHRKTELGKFDSFPYSPKNHDLLVSALLPAATHYHFTDKARATLLKPAQVVQTAVAIAWSGWRQTNARGEARAIILIEAIANLITSTFHVIAIDRRAPLGHKPPRSSAS